MARRHIGTVPWGGVIAICAILLVAPEVRGDIVVSKKKYTISGTIGLAGVSLQGLPGTPQTDQNGVYSVQVDSGWAGTVKPVKLGYTFQPPERKYATGVTGNQDAQDFMPKLLTFTISGSAGLPAVKMNGFPTEVLSDENGRYTATVDYGWSGNVSPEKMGYRFEPITRPYNQVTKNFQDDYKQYEVTFTISGSAGIAGVVMKGLPGDPVTKEGGLYSAEVRYGFSGKVAPTREGCTFTPEYQEYQMIVESQQNQDYAVQIMSYEISGSVGMPGVVLKGFPEDVVSDDNGFYRVTVNHGWAGKVTPEKAGWNFAPPSIEYKKVIAAVDNQNYNATVVYLKIEGTVSGVGQVTLTGLPGGTVTTDEKGVYSARVEYGWNGTVIPQKEGILFTPAERPYPSVTQDQLQQNFKGEKIYYEISGNVGMGGVQLKGLPGSVVSKPDGSYTVKVDYNWDGNVAPVKAGFVFEPSERPYTDVLTPQVNQDYTPRTIQYKISGRVLDKSGLGVDNVLLVADGQVESVVTDSEGAFELTVDHGWKGKITPQKEGWLFTPAVKPFDIPIGASVSNMAISGEIKMLTIKDIMKSGDEPITNVDVTAEPGGYKAKTDAKGIYAIKVPYGWTGSLSYFHPEFDITGTRDYVNVTEDIDEMNPKKPAPKPPTQPDNKPPTQPDSKPPTQPDNKPPTQPDSKPPTQPDNKPPTQPTGRELLIQQMDAISKKLTALLDQPGTVDQNQLTILLREYNQLKAIVNGAPEQANLPTIPQTQFGGPVVTGAITSRLLSTLAELARVTNTRIIPDRTVKDEPIPNGIGSVQGLPMNVALDRILTGAQKSYKWEYLSDLDEYHVYLPLTNTFPGSQIPQALQDIAGEVEVPIIPDPNVSGITWASFTEKPLEKALAMILAGTPYVFTWRPEGFYLVADRSIDAPGYFDVASPRRVVLNFNTPVRVRELLPLQYRDYVQAELASTVDPNDQGRILTITAPRGQAEMIAALIREIDKPRRQVLLDARVVALERGNMLNLGVAWDFPTLQYGRFSDGDNWLTGLGIGYAADQTFTNALMAKLNLLQSNEQADIVANPQLTAQDGSQAQIRSIQEEWFMMSDQTAINSEFGWSRAELQKIESGTILTITPSIGDSNQITLDMAVEVSDSIPRGADSDLPIITRRQTKNRVTIQNGGTVAVAGLTENRGRSVEQKVPVLGDLPIIGHAFRNKDSKKGTRDIAVFVTANLIAENGQMPNTRMINTDGLGIGNPQQPADAGFKAGLAEALGKQTPTQ